VSDDEFYVGWAGATPPATARFVRRVVAAAIAGALAVAVAILAAQARFAPGVFEYGTEREFVGLVSVSPAPRLAVAAPACTEWCTRAPSWLLTRSGSKRGADELVRAFDGRRVRLRGTLVYGGGETLLDVVPGSVEALGETPVARPAPAVEDLGEQTLIGEIVDAKCHFGVMRPGSGKAHRSCAARCIASGSPAMLWVRDAATGRDAHLLLVGTDGRALGRALLPWVAETVEIHGRVRRDGGLLVLAADPAAFRRR
jgi:hypothetical protein